MRRLRRTVQLHFTAVAADLGFRRRVDESSCNADSSCIKGFCPSFVNVEGVAPQRSKPVQAKAKAVFALPEPVPPLLQHIHNMLIVGIGGTSVIKVGALIGMAAHPGRQGSERARQDRHVAEERGQRSVESNNTGGC